MAEGARLRCSRTPGATVLIPCCREATTTGTLLQALPDETHPVKKRQILVVDCDSTDPRQRADKGRPGC